MEVRQTPRAGEDRPQWLSLTASPGLRAKEDDKPYGDSFNPEEKGKVTCQQLNTCWLQRPAGVSGAPRLPLAAAGGCQRETDLEKKLFYGIQSHDYKDLP